MRVSLKTDTDPYVQIEANEGIRLDGIEQRIRMLLAARRWLKTELKLKNERNQT